MQDAHQPSAGGKIWRKDDYSFLCALLSFFVMPSERILPFGLLMTQKPKLGFIKNIFYVAINKNIRIRATAFVVAFRKRTDDIFYYRSGKAHLQVAPFFEIIYEY